LRQNESNKFAANAQPLATALSFNASLVVNGDADLVYHLEMNDQKKYTVLRQTRREYTKEIARVTDYARDQLPAQPTGGFTEWPK
jgi:uncharacterized protein YihD (DUF1040 family)